MFHLDFPNRINSKLIKRASCFLSKYLSGIDYSEFIYSQSTMNHSSV